jgi:hypothetical protein
MVIRFFILSLFILLFVNAKTQIVLDRDTQKEILYIYEKQDNKMLLLDSLYTLNILSEYSYSEKNGVIYMVCSVTTMHGKTYYISTYALGEEKKLIFTGKCWMSESEYENLFRRGLSVVVNNKGIQLSFTSGKYSLIILSFDELNLKEVSRELSKIDELQK